MPARKKSVAKADRAAKAPAAKPAKTGAAAPKVTRKPTNAKKSTGKAKAADGVDRARKAVARSSKKTLIGTEPKGDLGVEKQRQLDAAAEAHTDPRGTGATVDPAPAHRNVPAENYDTFRQRRVGRLNVMINWFRRGAKPKQK